VGSAITAKNGFAKLQYSIPAGLGAGSHVITATFAGDTAYAASVGTGSLTVYFTTRLTLNNVTNGEILPLQASLRRDPDSAGVPGKTITFKLDGVTVGTQVTASNGVATLNYTVPAPLSFGNHTITAVFAGDAAYHTSSSTEILKVQRGKK
jgi:hypothetical protein